MNTIADVVHALAGAGGQGITMVAFTYRSKGTNELAKVVVTLSQPVEEIYVMDLEILRALEQGCDESDKVRMLAIRELINSREQSIVLGVGNNPLYTHLNTYTHIPALPGIIVHRETGELYIRGLVNSKTVIEPGTYKKVNHRAKTLEKKKIQEGLPSGKFRQYLISRIMKITIRGTTLEVRTGDDPNKD